MSMPPSTLPRSAHLVHVRAPRTGRGDAVLRERLARLGSRHDAAWCCAALLALLVDGHSRHERAAWAGVAGDVVDAPQLLEDALALTHAHWLPRFEHLARALAPAPVELRHHVIDAARRIMTADGMVSPMDQLRWVALRHLMAGSAVSPPGPASTELERLDAAQAREACRFSAFLSQMVPAPELTLDLTGQGSISQLWYDTVTARWQDVRGGMPPRESGHDVDAMLKALRSLQALSWLQRPVLVRSWFDAARVLTEGPGLHESAADALRLSCVLLDSPVPPELAHQYIEVEPAHS